MSMVSCGGDEPPEPEPPTQTTASGLEASTTPIVLPGSGSVTDRGTAAYNLPLSVPKGPAGWQPDLSINYTGSAASTGTLGIGFTLSGLSAIMPCRWSYAANRFSDGPDFGVGLDAGDDTYCLDGQRLAPYPDWANNLTPDGDGRVFHTEVETYQHVVAVLPDDPQPSAFVVYDRDGGRRDYEPVYARRYANADALSVPAETAAPIAVMYRLAEATDRNGNRIHYTYDAGDLIGTEIAPASEIPKVISSRLRRIDYAFDDNDHATRQVVINYTRRADEVIEYRWGVKLVLRSVINEIAMYVDTATNPDHPEQVAPKLAWRYLLDSHPSPDTGRSRLESIRMQESFNVDSWKRGFDWTTATTNPAYVKHLIPSEPPDLPFGDSPDAFDADAMSRDDATLAAYWVDSESNWLRPNDGRLMLFDLDADGDEDAIYRTRHSSLDFHLSGIDWWMNPQAGDIHLRKSGDGEPLTEAVYDLSEFLEPGMRQVDEDDDGGVSVMIHQYAFVNLGKSRIADLDGDGMLDLMLARTDVDETDNWESPGDDDYVFNQKWRYGFKTLFGYPGNAAVGAPFADSTSRTEISMTGAVWRGVSNFSYMIWEPYYAAPPYQRVLADLDGDGRTDVVDPYFEHPDSDPIDTTVEEWRSVLTEDHLHGQGMYRAVLAANTQPGDPYVEPPSFLPRPIYPDAMSYPWTCGNGFALATELDGDGRQDILVAGTPNTVEPLHPDPRLGSGVYRRLSLGDGAPYGNGFRTDTSALWVGDCHGPAADLAFGDFNGDGLVDALYPPGSYVEPNPFGELVPSSVPLVRWNLGTGFGPATPMLVNGGAPIQGLMQQNVPTGQQGSPVRWDRGTRVADVDGDGRSDVIAFRESLAECVDPYVENLPHNTDDPVCTNHVVVFRSRGDSFVAEEVYTTDHGFANLAQGFTFHQVGDVTGDGALDLVMPEHEELIALELRWTTQPDLLAAVKDASVTVPLETFTYQRNWWGNRPRSEGIGYGQWTGTACEWPNACPNGGATVVFQHKVYTGPNTAGTAMYRNDYHRFGRPRLNLTGRGSLGFGTHEIWERETGAWTQRTFANDRPASTGNGTYTFPSQALPDEVLHVVPTYAMAAASVLQSAGIDGGMSEMEYPAVVTWTHNTYDFPQDPDSPGIVRVDNIQTRTTEVDRTARLSLEYFPHYTAVAEKGTGSQTTVSRSYDGFGNVITQTADIRDGFGGPVVARRELQAQYDNYTMDTDGEAWLLGQPRYSVTRAYNPADAGTVPGSVTRYVSDEHTGNIESVTTAINVNTGCFDPACETIYSTTELAYDGRGNLISTAQTADTAGGPQTRTSSTEWDDLGIFPTSTTDALGITTTMTMHPWFGTPSQVTNVDDVSVWKDYDGFGRLIRRTRTGSPGLARAYSLVSGKLRVTDTLTDGTAHYDQYDDRGRVVESGQRGFGTHPWIYTRSNYDAVGNVVRRAEPSFSVGVASYITSTFDRLGRALTVTTPDHEGTFPARVTTYAHGLLSSSSTDPGGHVNYVKRDPAGRTIETGTLVSGDPKGELTFAYGPFDRIKTIRDAAGNLTVTNWAPTTRELTRDDPDTGITEARYDGFGQLVESSFPNGDVVSHEYDLGGRLVETTSPEGTTSRIYDVGSHAMGKPSITTSPDGISTAYSYDANGRMRTLSQIDGTATYQLQYRYDAFGRVRYEFYPTVSGHHRFAVRHDYGNDGFLRELVDVSACDISPTGTAEVACTGVRIWRVDERDERLQLDKASYGPTASALSEDRDYGPTGKLTKTTQAGVTTTYTYDADGLLETRDDPWHTEDFTHDELHRIHGWTVQQIATWNPPAVGYEYAYDEIGNLTDRLKDHTVDFHADYGYLHRPHGMRRTTVPTTQSYTYDTRGRQLTGPNRTVDYNSLDLPVELVQGTSTRTYAYDADGQRARRITNPGSISESKIRYLGQSYEHRSSSLGTPRHLFYVYGDGALVAQVDYFGATETTRYSMGDSLGTGVTFNAGTPERQYFDPFGNRVDVAGNLVADPDSVTTRGFTGHEEENSAGLINMQGRIYDPRQFRFLTPDPMITQPLFGQAYNPYSYVQNNPLNQTDPSGFGEEDLPTDGEDVSDGPGDASFDVIGPPAPPPPPQTPGTSDDSDDTSTSDTTGSTTVADDGGSVMERTSEVTDRTSPVAFSWEMASPAWDATKKAWAYAGNDRNSTLSRMLAYVGAAAALPVASYENLVNAAPNAVLAAAKSTYETWSHYGRAYDMYQAGSEGWSMTALEGAQISALGVFDAAMFMASAGEGGPQATRTVKLLVTDWHALYQPTGRIYSTVFSVRIPGELWGTSSRRHMAYANKMLKQAMAEIPALEAAVPKPRWGTSPSGYIWQHATWEQGDQAYGWLHLVPVEQHTPGSIFWRALHPGPNGAGGFWEWAKPLGAAR